MTGWQGAKITTIEGLAAQGGAKLQALWAELNVPQCGYCQAGMLMAAADSAQENPKPSDADIDEAMTNICRCGTYPRVKRSDQARGGSGGMTRSQPALNRRQFLASPGVAAGGMALALSPAEAAKPRCRAQRPGARTRPAATNLPRGSKSPLTIWSPSARPIRNRAMAQ